MELVEYFHQSKRHIMNQVTFDEQVKLFVQTLQGLYNDYYAEHCSVLTVPTITASYGQKYVKIVCDNSVYCFIDSSNGDLLKAAGWRGPAKGARGNIFNSNCDVGIKANVYGGGLYK